MKVSVHGKFDNDFFTAISLNISATGLLIETDIPLSRGNRITCTFTLGSGQMAVEAEVARVSVLTKNSYRYGVRFVKIDERMRARIEEMVSVNRKRDAD